MCCANILVVPSFVPLVINSSKTCMDVTEVPIEYTIHLYYNSSGILYSTGEV